MQQPLPVPGLGARSLRAWVWLLALVFGGMALPRLAEPEPVDLKTFAREPEPAKPKPMAAARKLVPFDLNLADSSLLVALPGIGPKAARRILARRSVLGGFSHPAQLEEVGGLSERARDSALLWARVTPAGRALMPAWACVPAEDWPVGIPLDLNALSLNELYDLGWLRASAAKALLARRRQLGGFADWNDVGLVKGLRAGEYRLLRRLAHLGPVNKLNLNTVTAADLDELPGIGPKLAAAIVQKRHQMGRFAQVEDLLNVPGLGPVKLQALRPRVYVAP